ncbi:MAG: sugar phosphate isomerase/epimerase [Opitutaceae bacterium]
MTPRIHLTRREAVRTVALGALALPFLKTSLAAAESPAIPAVVGSTGGADPMGREHGLRLGVASYSTRTMTLDETISVLGLLRVKNTGLFKAHCDWESGTVEQCSAVGAKLKAAGLNLTGSGVINLPNDEAKLRKAFENVRAAQMATMVCKPQLAALPAIEKLVKEFDQKIAIHNHGPEDTLFPTPQSAFDVIKTLDARIGLCVDIGHAARAGVDPAASIRQYAARVYDIHMKDSVAIVGATKDIPVEVGAGRLDIRSILAALRDIKYNGVVAFEYEKPAANPVTGLAESLGYVRGMLAAMT